MRPLSIPACSANSAERVSSSGFLLAEPLGLGGERIRLLADLRQPAGEERVAFFEPLPLLFGVLLNAGEFARGVPRPRGCAAQFGQRLVLAACGRWRAAPPRARLPAGCGRAWPAARPAPPAGLPVARRARTSVADCASSSALLAVEPLGLGAKPLLLGGGQADGFFPLGRVALQLLQPDFGLALAILDRLAPSPPSTAASSFEANQIVLKLESVAIRVRRVRRSSAFARRACSAARSTSVFSQVMSRSVSAAWWASKVARALSRTSLSAVKSSRCRASSLAAAFSRSCSLRSSRSFGS